MTKKILFIIVSLFFVQYGFGQNDIQIVESQATIVDKIKKGREILLENFLSGEAEKTDKMFLYLNKKVEHTDYAAFAPYETIILSVYYGHYQDALNEITYFDSISKIENKFQISQRIYPREDDGLSMKLTERYLGYKFLSFEDIKMSALKDDEKEALMLILDNIFLAKEQENPYLARESVQKKINERSHSFLTLYPHSKYADYVRKYVLFETKKSDWGMTVDFWGGYAALFGNAANYFTNSGIAGFAFTVMYKKWNLFLGGDLLFSKLKQDIYFDNTVWLQNSSTSSGHAAVQIGYSIIDSKYITVIPFVGAGYMSFDPNSNDIEYDRALKDKSIGSFAYSVGINTDIIWKDFSQTGGNLPLRLRLAYVKPTSFSSEYQCDMLTLTLGISIQTRNMVRKKI